ncbi:hypothetical protein S40285_07563 [Stachybotrys chlorohalonatus IBT 40285]|uniref:Uncharacterized protein n=1 Tax=Stachybotrys chlorohalonatus (strain IBT 40285) TaxID=1283841 RepID=A0A084Q8B4_STAC4|nr:hypothetical protein S40285_07563 [Stachybotrys chlorohalonata IBT 40285]
MKGRPVDQLVYEYMYPKPKPTDPNNFQMLLQRNLIPEVRHETQAFYGHLDTQEAKYPGLDYTHPTHRMRLCRWTWHRRFFRAIDALRLTPAEIAGLTKWEGTKWAKEKFEKEQGIVIRDTTADELSDWTDPSVRDGPTPPVQQDLAVEGRSDEVKMDEDEDSDEELESVGIELNERLRAQAARREAGDTSAVIDEEWEQWLKNLLENGDTPFFGEAFADELFQRVVSSGTVPASLFPPAMINAARAGLWQEIPESLHPMIRRAIEAQSQATAPRATRSVQPDGELVSRTPLLVNPSGRLFVRAEPYRRQAQLRPVSSDVRNSAAPA